MNRRDFLRAGLKSALLVAAVTTGLGRTSIQPEKKAVTWSGNLEVIDVKPGRIVEAAEYQWKEYGVTVSVPNDKVSRRVAEQIEKRIQQTKRDLERSIRRASFS